jgi:hypothetical protein
MCHFADADNVKTIVPSLLPTSIHQEIVRYLLAEDATTTTIKLLQRPQLLLFITVPRPSPNANLRYLTSLDRLGICASSARARGNTGWLVTRRSTLELFTYTMSAKNSHLSFISHSQITFTLLAQVAASIVAVSPKFGLMPTSSFPLEALTPFITTWRSALCLQLPQERYSFPNVSTVKLLMVTVPAPFCWMTLSWAPVAPPPVIVASPSPLRDRASVRMSILNLAASWNMYHVPSHTAAHHTFVIVQEPSQ